MIKASLKRLPVALCLCLSAGVWANINPLQVNELITHAVQTHPLVSSAVADKVAAAEGVTAAKLGFLPTPTVQSTHDSDDGQVTSIVIRQPLWTGGRLTASVNQAINDDKAAAAYVLERQNEVAKNTIDIWRDYIYALSLQDLYQGNIRQLGEFEEMMNRRVAQGISARIELDLVTNRILQDQNALQGAIEQQKIAEARLEQLIGQPIAARVETLQLGDLVRLAKEGSADFATLAFGGVSQTHPSVIRQHYTVESAKHEVKAQRASRYPTVFVQFENDYYHKSRRHADDVMFGLSYDPGAGFSNLALARASEARVQSLAHSQEASRRTVMENIQTQYQQFVSARDQELSLAAAVSGAQIVLDSYRRQFIAGRKSWLEVLNAVRDQSQYEQQLRQTQAQMVASYYKLQVDFGVMPWQQMPAQALLEPSVDFSPVRTAREWVGEQQAYWQNRLNQPQESTSTIASEGAMISDVGTGVAVWQYDGDEPVIALPDDTDSDFTNDGVSDEVPPSEEALPLPSLDPYDQFPEIVPEPTAQAMPEVFETVATQETQHDQGEQNISQDDIWHDDSAHQETRPKSHLPVGSSQR